MNKLQLKTVRCRRCGQTRRLIWRSWGSRSAMLYRKSDHVRIEVFRLVCPHCGNVEMLEVTFEERRDA